MRTNNMSKRQDKPSTSGSTGDVRYRKSKSHKEYPSSIYDMYEDNYKDKKNRRPLLGVSIDDMAYLCGLFVVSLLVRLYDIRQPSSVVFDEVHFGGFATKYIKGRFFMDVHPPLAKLLITLAGVLGGFEGNFDFKEIGKDYLEPKVPYVSMRLMPAFLGVMVIPMAYLTIKLAGFSRASAFLVATLLIFENGLVTQSRLILLDSPLVAAVSFTTLMWVKFQNEQQRPFQFWWWFWMSMTGVGIGLTVSMKWVGLFTMAFIGLSTVKGLWDVLGDLKIPPLEWIKHFFARFLCLLVIPFVLYLFFFLIHFAILQNSGDGDGFMSSEFRMTLGGHKTQEATPIDVAFGSSVSIKHVNTLGGYLHSHKHTYPGGSKQQQVTLYPHQDENNVWLIQNKTDPEIPFNVSEPSWIYHDAVIRLYHPKTYKRLHSHDVRPPVTEADYQNEVSAYGYEGFAGDANDFWKVEIVDHDKSDPQSRERLRTLHTKFRLQHTITGCYLFSHSIKLPEWGFEQQEVTCVKGGSYEKTLWYIETNSHPTLPNDTEKVTYKMPGFLSKVWELNKVMWNTNKGLTDDHPYDSRPPSWVSLKRGISFWGKDHRSIYLLGNPLVWWSSSIAIICFLALEMIIILRSKRGYKDHLNINKQHFESWAALFFMGWCLHYFPFYLMARQLFLHHYFPALYFAVLLVGVGFDLFTFRLSNRKKMICALIIISISITIFYMFSPLTYGGKWTKSSCKSMKWIDTWDFDCEQYHSNYEEYMNTKIENTATSEGVREPKENLIKVDDNVREGQPIIQNNDNEKIIDDYSTKRDDKTAYDGKKPIVIKEAVEEEPVKEQSVNEVSETKTVELFVTVRVDQNGNPVNDDDDNDNVKEEKIESKKTEKILFSNNTDE
ncbi:hypothetical protein Glove_216g188 [Diversispora epigaea]|uniref:Dolichyl-phosphate-mannose--protein mannosyltransferase n=1 Tax=Diversispora epigaea TaxID=1348612 RepID=A0A397IQF4_9GLOM|nr:hypothetical protein Glove_216g188 [Diversispora epigaea]